VWTLVEHTRLLDAVETIVGATDTKRHVIHGLFTYDYFAILKVVTRPDGTFLPATQLKTWKPISFPIAFIVYGETETIPWDDEGLN
jgi:hypothetical protein